MGWRGHEVERKGGGDDLKLKRNKRERTRDEEDRRWIQPEVERTGCGEDRQ